MYKLKFIDSYRFIQNSLSGLVDNLPEINNKISQETLIKIILTHINYVIKILINLIYY